MNTKREKQIIDVKDKVLGRIASQIVAVLRGKDKPDFLPHIDSGDFVVIKNVDKIKVTGKKYTDKIYFRHSGYMGGVTETPYERIFEKDPKEVLKRAVYGMMPKNKLRDKQIKRLLFE